MYHTEGLGTRLTYMQTVTIIKLGMVYTYIHTCLARNNHLSGLPQELGNCSGLRDIVLSFNRLKELPPVLYTLEKLENIIADDNQVQ